MRPQSDCPGLGNLPGAPSLRCSHGREMLGHPVHECDSPRLTEFLSVQWLTEASLQQLERCCYPCLTQEADFHERPQLTSFHTLITTTTTIPPAPLLQKGGKWRVVQCQDWGGAKLLDGKGHCAPGATPRGHDSLVCRRSVPELFSSMAGSAESLLSLTFFSFIYPRTFRWTQNLPQDKPTPR